VLGRQGKNAKKGNTVSVNVGGTTILLFKATDEPGADVVAPIELAFQDRYGEILSHQWFGDGYIVLGFASGYVRAPATLQLIASGRFPLAERTRRGHRWL
jgi:hypothetical protein